MRSSTHTQSGSSSTTLSLLSLDRRRGEKDIELRSPLALDSHGEGGGVEGCVYAVGFFSVEERPTKKRSWWRGDKNTRTHDEDRKCMCA